MGIYKLVIPGNTPSLKNSKQVVKTPQGKTRVIPSVTYEKWKPAALEALYNSPLRHKEWKYPLRLSFHFIRDSERRFDYINIAQGPCDVMVQAGIIEDDDAHHVIPGDFSYQVVKDAACCIVTIEEWGSYERKQSGVEALKGIEWKSLMTTNPPL